MWTEAEKKFIRYNAARVNDSELLVLINKMRIAVGRPVTTIYFLRSFRESLGINRPRGRPRSW
jgi:hypothetical protein